MYMNCNCHFFSNKDIKSQNKTRFATQNIIFHQNNFMEGTIFQHQSLENIMSTLKSLVMDKFVFRKILLN